jgi:hypothetical protein
MITIAHAKPHEVDLAWEYCQRFFADFKRFKYQNFQPEEIYLTLKEDRSALFVAVEKNKILGACVVSLEETKTGGRSLFVPIMGGVDFKRWYKTLADFVEKFAKENNCKTIEYIGRAGFSKLDNSYVEDGRIYVKEIK